MFDQPPSNLPLEPQNPVGPVPEPPLVDVSTNRPAASVPKPASAGQAGASMMSPKRQEPEDIFSDLDKGDAAAAMAAANAMPEARGGSRGMRIALYGGIGLVLVVLLAGGGWFLYQRFVAAPEQAPAVTTPVPQAPIEPSTTEAPPAVEPTPPPTPQERTPEVSTEAPPTSGEGVPDGIPTPTPVSPGQPADTDGDGLSDTQEQALGTDLSVADTDGDGLSDGEEVSVQKTNPSAPDTDGDGLTDGDEVRLWHTNPTNVDSDGDTYQDGQEISNGFNPNGAGKLPANQ